MSPRRLALALALLAACNDGTVTSESASTGSSADTGEPTGGPLPDPCDPALPPIPEAEFAERFAETICEQKLACGCNLNVTCSLDFFDGFALIRDDGQNLGLTYDGACAARKLAGLVQSRGCTHASEIDVSPSCTLDCLVYRGAVAPAGACTSSSVLLTTLFADKCAAPDNCSADVCSPPLPTVAEGQPCVTPLANCKANAACDFAGSKLCEPLRGVGEACLDNGVCRQDLYCGGDGKCIARAAADAPCTDNKECASRRCTNSKCEEWVWICAIDEEIDIFGRHPSDF